MGHVPANVSSIFYHFLSREGNYGTVKVTGSRVNRGAGYGLEIPCLYTLFGSTKYLQRLATLVDELKSKKLL